MGSVAVYCHLCGAWIERTTVSEHSKPPRKTCKDEGACLDRRRAAANYWGGRDMSETRRVEVGRAHKFGQVQR